MSPFLAEDLELRRETVGADRGRFVLERAGKEVGVLTYRSVGLCIHADHTFVDPELRGERLGARLVEALAAWVRTEEKQIVAECSYVRAELARHPEWQDLLNSSAPY